MTFLEFWRMDRFFTRHPHTSLLVAAYVGYKPPIDKDRINSIRDAARANSQALQTSVHPRIGTLGQMLGRKAKTIDQMPEYVRSPEMMALIAKMKTEMGVTADA